MRRWQTFSLVALSELVYTKNVLYPILLFPLLCHPKLLPLWSVPDKSQHIFIPYFFFFPLSARGPTRRRNSTGLAKLWGGWPIELEGALKDDILCPINIIFFSGSDVRSPTVARPLLFLHHPARDNFGWLLCEIIDWQPPKATTNFVSFIFCSVIRWPKRCAHVLPNHLRLARRLSQITPMIRPTFSWLLCHPMQQEPSQSEAPLHII
jgi:hypothetical protein